MASRFKSLRKTFKRPAVRWSLLIAAVAISVVLLIGLLSGDWRDAFLIGLAVAILGTMGIGLWLFYSMEKEDRLARGAEDEGQPAEIDADAGGIENDFVRAVAEIRGSRLGAGGLEALPWLMTLGESGEGKTAAMRESGLELPAEYASRVSGAPTESCDWWLTNDAIVLDMAGRYLLCDDDATAEQWRGLLRLLRKQRPGVALNGLIFVISVDSLLTRSGSDLEEVARSLRRRVNEATDELGVDLPIYMLVSKLDHVEGFSECVSVSPVFRPDRALGWTNDQRVLADAEERVIDGFRGLIERLEAIVPELMMREPDRVRRRRIFAFPAELDQTVRALAAFVGRAFAPTPYDAPPFLRGVYLCSARREGTTVSPQLHRLGHDWARTDVEGALNPGGVFLRDVFADIVIGDRDVALPVDRFGKRMRTALNAAAAAVVLLLVVWWGVSFVSNWIGINRLAGEARAVADGSSSLVAMDALRAAIEEEDADRRLARGGGLAGPAELASERAKQTFVWAFGRELEVLTKRKLIAVVKGFDSGAFEALAQLATDVTWLAARGRGEDVVAPDIARYAPISANASDVEAFARGYRDFVRWSSHSDVQTRIDQERDAVASASARLLELGRLEAWAGGSRAYRAISYGSVGLPGAGAEMTEVSGAYTRRAWDGLVVRLLEAIDSTGSASTKAKQFRDTYVKRFDAQWRQLLMDTPLPIQSHADVRSSPYLDYVEMLQTNTSAELPRREPPPAWVLTLREALREVPAEAGPPAPEGEEAKPPPPPPWKVYQDLLVPVMADTEAALADSQAAVGLSEQMAARAGSTSFEKAYKQVRKMVPRGDDAEGARMLEEILGMPILDAGSAVMGRSFGQLDGIWHRRVVEPSAGRLTTSKLQILYGKGGAVDELRSGPLAPFYRNGRAVSVLGNRTLPFGPRFLGWMKNAERLMRVFSGAAMGADGTLIVRLKGRPARIAGGSGLRVASSTLRLRCDSGTDKWEYTQGGGQHSFRWSPDCDELYVTTVVVDGGRNRELTPTMEWKGPMAMPLFLQQANRSGDILHWTLRYPDAGATVDMYFELREGDEVRALRHKDPPSSMGR